MKQPLTSVLCKEGQQIYLYVSICVCLSLLHWPYWKHLLEAFKKYNIPSKSGQISSNFNPPEHNQDPGGQVKDIISSLPPCTTNWRALKEYRIILAWVNHMFTIIILIVKPIQSSENPFCAADVILKMNANNKHFWIQSLAFPRFSLPISPANANLNCYSQVIPSLINLIKEHVPSVPC